MPLESTEPPIPTNTVGLVSVRVSRVGVLFRLKEPPWLTKPAAAAAVFFFNDTATTEIYTLSLHDALPIFGSTIASREPTASWTVLTPTTDAASPCTATP